MPELIYFLYFGKWNFLAPGLKNVLHFRQELARPSYFPITIEKGKNFAEFIQKSPILEFLFKAEHLET